MNLKLIKEVGAPLLYRKRLTFEVNYPGSKTPSREDIKKTVASLQKVKEELISIRHIYPKFGESKAKLIVHIYNSLKDIKKYEPKKEKKEKKPVEKKEEPKEKKVEEKKDAKEESKEQKAE